MAVPTLSIVYHTFLLLSSPLLTNSYPVLPGKLPPFHPTSSLGNPVRVRWENLYKFPGKPCTSSLGVPKIYNHKIYNLEIEYIYFVYEKFFEQDFSGGWHLKSNIINIHPEVNPIGQVLWAVEILEILYLSPEIRKTDNTLGRRE